MSSVEDARAALESKTRITAGSRSQHTGIMAAADALGDARELRGHDLLREWIERQGSLPPLARCMVCGFMDKHEAKCLVKRTLAVLPDAPVKEVTHDDD